VIDPRLSRRTIVPARKGSFSSIENIPS
jgi:hypothetical protein